MKNTNRELDTLLDGVLADIKRDEPDRQKVDAAAQRVWARVASQSVAADADAAASMTEAPAEAAVKIHNCADFQSLIPSYLRRELTPARRLLLEDHTHECIPCRRALKAARHGDVRRAARASVAEKKSGGKATSLLARPPARWAIAASLILVFGLAIVPLVSRLTPYGGNLDPVVQAVNGPVYVVDDARTQTIAAGQELKRGGRLRTAKEAGAVVRLPDGSSVEVRERSEFSVSENSQGTTIHLDRGSVIVQAAKQRRDRHLYVATGDCLVSVIGTVFSVNSGTKGSRVSVIEGEVHVDHSGAKDVLRPGDQVTTRESLNRIPITQEVAWSRDAARYAQVLAGLQELRQELEQNAPVPGVRYSTRLLDAMPEDTVFYAALPNLSNTIGESYRIVQEQTAKNEALREWLRNREGQGDSGKNRPDAAEVVEKLRRFGDKLGEEIVVSLPLGEAGRPGAPLVVAELADAPGFRALIESELQSSPKGAAQIRFVENPLQAIGGQNSNELLLWIHDDLCAASPQLDGLKKLALNLQAPASNRFREKSFHSRLAGLYRDGAGLIVAADLQGILGNSLLRPVADAESREARRVAAMNQLGVNDLQHFIVEIKQQDGRGSNRAVLSFADTRRGIASWLAAPGPMGALEYVSPDANVATAFVVKDPTALVDDLLGALGTIDPALRQTLGNFETQYGLEVRRDFAAPLGGEFAFAVDGPVLPSPSWKMVLEVNDPALMQSTLERVVTRLNELAARENRRGFEWARSEGPSGRTFYTLKSIDLGLEVSYLYLNGYFVMTPNRALLDRAVRYRESGVSLVTSQKFRAALPADGQANFSALFYHNLSPLIGPLAERLGRAGGAADEASLTSLTDVSPTLAYAYAQNDQIVVSANTDRGPLGLNPGSLLGATGAFGLRNVLTEAARDDQKSAK